MLRPSKNIKIFFNYILGPLLGAWLFYSLYKQIQAQPHLHQSLLMIKNAPFGNQAWKFWTVIILTFLNWGLEARKWQVLMKNLQPLSFWIAFKSVLSGVTLSLNTPNRIGEYGGRIIYIREGNRIKSISLSIAGSITQLIITLFVGCGGLLFLIKINNGDAPIMGLSIYWIKVLFFISACTTFGLLLFLFRLSWFIKLLEKIPGLNKHIQYIVVLDEFIPKLLLRILFLSLLRYLVFIIQYIYLLQVLQVQIAWQQGFWTISVLYLVMAIVPSFAIADLGIRGKFSIELLHFYSVNTIGIIGATFGIWFINLFIPGLAGSILIIGKRYFKDDKKISV
jgi:hypothetical protein